jgi:NCAIR mutase (PurE)-related protein
MNPRDVRELLDRVAAGALSPEQALEDLAELPYADLGFAKLDLHRELRNGHPEAVYAEGKRTEDLLEITRRFLTAHGRVLVTRLSREAAAALVDVHPQATYHERARILTAGTPREPLPGIIAVLAAGTSDLAVAEEAAVCAAWFGHAVTRTFDVGVAGIHRLLGNLAEVRRADVVVAVAGMDGALPTVVASLVAAPVVAVPTSVGYGASFGGLAALLTMLNGCAPGVGVVNIDNGFGAAVLASRIARRIGGETPQPALDDIHRSASMASP